MLQFSVHLNPALCVCISFEFIIFKAEKSFFHRFILRTNSSADKVPSVLNGTLFLKINFTKLEINSRKNVISRVGLDCSFEQIIFIENLKPLSNRRGNFYLSAINFNISVTAASKVITQP